MTDGQVINVTSAAFDQAVINADVPVLVDFWAEWCGPCKMIAPTLEALAAEYGGKVRIAKVNVDQNQEIAMRYGIRSIPTLMLFKNGQPVETTMGVQPKEQLAALIDRQVA